MNIQEYDKLFCEEAARKGHKLKLQDPSWSDNPDRVDMMYFNTDEPPFCAGPVCDNKKCNWYPCVNCFARVYEIKDIPVCKGN